MHLRYIKDKETKDTIETTLSITINYKYNKVEGKIGRDCDRSLKSLKKIEVIDKDSKEL